MSNNWDDEVVEGLDVSALLPKDANYEQNLAAGGLVTPTVSLKTLALAMGAIRPRDLAAKLRVFKYRNKYAVQSYENTREYLRRLVGTTAFQNKGRTEPLYASAYLGKDLAPHEVSACGAIRALLPLLWDHEWKPTAPSPARWIFDGIVVDSNYELELKDGCLKLVCNLEPLPKNAGRRLASLLYHVRANVFGLKTAMDNCLVFEPRTAQVYRPFSPSKTTAMLTDAYMAAKTIWALWPTV